MGTWQNHYLRLKELDEKFGVSDSFLKRSHVYLSSPKCPVAKDFYGALPYTLVITRAHSNLARAQGGKASQGMCQILAQKNVVYGTNTCCHMLVMPACSRPRSFWRFSLHPPPQAKNISYDAHFVASCTSLLLIRHVLDNRKSKTLTYSGLAFCAPEA